jgi:transglycosylase-like protein
MRSSKQLLAGIGVVAALGGPVSVAVADAPASKPKAQASAARVASHRKLVDRTVRLASIEARLSGKRLRPSYRSSVNTWSNERLRGRSVTLKRSIRQLRRYSGLPAVAPAMRKKLERIAACESGGNPRAVGGGGRFRGLFQFDMGTWRSVGGKGDPVNAPAEEQYRRAAVLYRQRGSSPWPVCGR